MNKISNSRFFHAGFGCLVLALSAGCSKAADTSSPTIAEPEAKQADHARVVLGDVVPARIYKLSTPPSLTEETLSVSTASSPKIPLGLPTKMEARSFKETYLFIDAGSTASTVSIPIDAPDGATIHLLPRGTDEAGHLAALRDLQLFEPSGKTRLDLRVAKAADSLKDKDAESLPMVSIDLPAMTKGSYSLKVGDIAAKTGVAIFVQLPKSTIQMDVTPSDAQFFPGDKGSVSIKLADAGAPITGASLEGHLVRPDGSPAQSVAIRELGDGVYQADVANAVGANDPYGMYNVFVRAKGTSNGASFDRFGTTAMQFVVPNGRLLGTAVPRTNRDADGKIVSFDVDVNVEAASTDRFEVSALLTTSYVDGTERPVAEAQTASIVNAGNSTITLHFEAGFIALSKFDGVLNLRRLTLYSQGTFSLLHRLGLGLDVKMPAFKLAELKALDVLPPRLQKDFERKAFEL